MQIHYALKAPPQWKTPALAGVALTHLTPGLDGVSKAVNEAERGMLPAVPTICVGQPVRSIRAVARPAPQFYGCNCRKRRASLRATPPAKSPRRRTAAGPKRAGEIRRPDRGDPRLALRDFRDNVIARKAYSPADLEALNVNLVGGDPYGGFCGIDQFFLWRPFHYPSTTARRSRGSTTLARRPIPARARRRLGFFDGEGFGLSGSGFLSRRPAC